VEPAQLYEIQLQLECKRLLPSGRLGEFPCANPDGLALISVVRFLDGSGEAIRLREDADNTTADIAARLAIDDLLAPHLGASAKALLRRNFAGRTGIFPSESSVDANAHAERDGRRWVVRIGERITAVAFSAREDESAAELSVETESDHRGRGYAKAVAAAWARDVIESGRIAFYSYDYTNTASGALAQSLGVTFQFEAGSFDLLPERP
jgi:RimJ/RimL family protein N-acetyltransferase